MQRGMELLEVAVALLLVVIALSLQLQFHLDLTNRASKTVQIQIDSSAALRWQCDGAELAVQIAVLSEKKAQIYIFQGQEYDELRFSQEILGIKLKSEESKLEFLAIRPQDLLQRQFEVYQAEGKWRIEEK